MVEVRGPAETVTKFLQEQPELASVEREAERRRPDDVRDQRQARRKDLREELATRLAAKGWGIRRLDLRRVSLEELFTGGGAAAEAPGPDQLPARTGRDRRRNRSQGTETGAEASRSVRTDS